MIVEVQRTSKATTIRSLGGRLSGDLLYGRLSGSLKQEMSNLRRCVMPSIFSRSIFGWAMMFFAALAASSVAFGQSGAKLFNGWTITPAGTVIPLDHLESVVQEPASGKPVGNMSSDLPLKMIVSPDGKVLLAACADTTTRGWPSSNWRRRRSCSSSRCPRSLTDWPSAPTASGFSWPAATRARSASLLMKTAS